MVKGVVYVGQGKVEVQDLPMPVTGPGEVLVKVEYCALCATDIHLVYKGLFGVTPPMIVGHELSGTIVEIGGDVPDRHGFQVGDKVTMCPTKFCGVCAHCQRGLPTHCKEADFDPEKKPMDAMAEYRTCEPGQLYKLPDDVPLEYAALVEPITTVCRGLELADMPLGSTVCVSGAGSIGLIMVDVLKYRGATRLTVVEPVPQRRRMAFGLGAQHVIDPTTQDVVAEGMRITDGMGYDFVFEMSGVSSAALLCPQLIGRRGCVEFFAVYPEDYHFPLNLFQMFSKEARIQFTFTNPFLYPKSIDLLGRLDMDQLLGPIYSIDEAPKAFEAFQSSQYPKLLVKCSQE